MDSTTGIFTLEEIYAVVRAAGTTSRDDGNDRVPGHGSDTRWRRRARGLLQTLKRDGRARRIGDSVWVLEGPPAAPTAALLVSLSGSHREIELRLTTAADLLRTVDEPIDLGQQGHRSPLPGRLPGAARPCGGPGQHN